MLKVLKYLPFLLIAIALSFLCFVVYKSEIQHLGDNRNYYFPYFLFGAIFLVGSFSLIFLKESVTLYVTIYLAAAVVGLYAFEGASKFLYDAKKEKIIRQKSEILRETEKTEFDLRSKLEVLDDLKLKENNAVVAVFPKQFPNLHSLSGVSLSRTVHCNENGYWSLFNSDRYGFNNPDNAWDEKEIDLVVVGDSFGLGACLNKPDDIVSYVRETYAKSVINLAYDDNGPLIEYASLREYLPYGIKNVIWMFFEGNDLWNLELELQNSTLLKYLDDPDFSQGLKSRQGEIDILANLLIKSNSKFTDDIEMKNFLKLASTRTLLQKLLPATMQPNAESERVLKQFSIIINAARDLSEKQGANFYFVYLPSYEQYRYKGLPTPYKTIKKSVQDLNIEFIDIPDQVFESHADPLALFPFKLKGHYNKEGSKLVGTAIAKSIFNLEEN